MDNFKPLLEFLTLNMVLSAAGGLIKIMFGIAKGTMTFLQAFTALFVAILLGVYAGNYVEWYTGSSDLGGITNVIIGIAAYNVAEAVDSMGFKRAFQRIVDTDRRDDGG